MKTLVEHANGRPDLVAWGAGFLDGVLWLITRGWVEAQHLAKHVKDKDVWVFVDLAAQGMAILRCNHFDVMDYVHNSGRSTEELAAIVPKCGPAVNAKLEPPQGKFQPRPHWGPPDDVTTN